MIELWVIAIATVVSAATNCILLPQIWKAYAAINREQQDRLLAQQAMQKYHEEERYARMQCKEGL